MTPEDFQAGANLIRTFEFIEQASQVTIPDVAVVLSPDIDGMAWLLARVRYAIRLLQDAAVFVEDEIVKIMPSKEREIDGLGVIEMHTGAKRTQWDKDGLINAMIHVLARDLPNLLDMDTGEQVNLVQLAEKLVGEFIDAATPSWKVTGLRKHGIDPDQYCSTSWGRKTIQTPTLVNFRGETE